MRFVLAALVVVAAGWAQTAPGPQPDARNAMAASIEKQRASIQKQISSVTGRQAQVGNEFFSVPWTDTPATAVIGGSAPCDPLASQSLENLITQSSEKEGVKPELIRAVIAQESGGRPCALSSKGAQGLMQLMPATAAQFGVSDPFDPKQNVDAGTKLLKQLLAKYKGDIALALSAYNAGEGRVDRDGGIPPIAETIQYVTAILARTGK